MNKDKTIRLGIIGYGFRINVVSEQIKKLGDVRVVSICDRDLDAAREKAAVHEPNADEIRFFTSAEELLDGPKVDGILIGTNCSSHTDMAVKVMEQEIPLFLEKPVAVNEGQLVRMREASKIHGDKVVVSFPLRLTPWVDKVKEIVDSGVLGTIEHVQAVNNVPYGYCYFQFWYRDNAETGGLWLQKATHDFDYINHILGQKPTMIAATTSKQVFTGNHPEGLHCVDCAEKETCLESPYNPGYIEKQGELMGIVPEQFMCAFAPDAGNEDSGSCIILYESGMHVSYSQNFYVKQKASKRGARLMGYLGTVEFDWYSDEIKVYYHHREEVETHKLKNATSEGHGGGDEALARNFIGLIKGEFASMCPLDQGVLSAEMCLTAKRSSQNQTFEKIN